VEYHALAPAPDAPLPPLFEDDAWEPAADAMVTQAPPLFEDEALGPADDAPPPLIEDDDWGPVADDISSGPQSKRLRLRVKTPQPAQLPTWYQALEIGGQEDVNAHARTVYLVTFSRILNSTLENTAHLRNLENLSREEVKACVINALEDPEPNRVAGGRPRSDEDKLTVEKVIVVRETHADGTFHFHVGVKLSSQSRFAAARRTLATRHGLASHWSSSHTQWWSVVRYMTHTNPPHKPHVDGERLVWSAPGVLFDVFEDAQERFLAKAWTKRREHKDEEAGSKTSRTTFSKLDFCELVIEKELKTKKRVLAYAQDYGTASMQSFCAKNQRQLKDLLEDAREWDTARTDAAMESKSDWEILCVAADETCRHGGLCVYAKAARDFFAAHACSFSPQRLAVALRAIIMNGPSKEHRVPFLIGATNTGKSTIIESFDSLFGVENVFHLPAETDTKGGALRGWMQDGTRMVFWDEFEPVVFVAKGVMPKSQFLKAFNGQTFEIQMNQRTHDGNTQFKWNRGAVFTAKEQGLWDLRAGVTEEDIAHMCGDYHGRLRARLKYTSVHKQSAPISPQLSATALLLCFCRQSRVDVFRCSGHIQRRTGGVPQCKHCLARWIRDESARHDADVALMATQALPSLTKPYGDSEGQVIAGLGELTASARIPCEIASELHLDLVNVGACDVRELYRSDWTALPVWAKLLPMQKRRLLSAVGIAPTSPA